MFAKALVEFIGTFILISVILAAIRPEANISLAPIAIGVALSAAIFFGGAISGGHFNPAVTLMSTMNGSMEWRLAAFYVIAQLLGASAAVGLYKYLYP